MYTGVHVAHVIVDGVIDSVFLVCAAFMHACVCVCVCVCVCARDE